MSWNYERDGDRAEVHITRAELQRAIEGGIRRATDYGTSTLSKQHVADLRRISTETKEVLVGAFGIPPYCPATQAGVYQTNEQEPHDLSVVNFARGFDACMDRITDRYGGCYLAKVVDDT